MTCVDTELQMPGSLRALGTSDFAATFIHELMQNVSDLPRFDAAPDSGELEDGGLYCRVARVVRDGDIVTVTVAFEFDAPPRENCGADEACGAFDVVLDIAQQRALVIDESSGL